MTHFMYYLGEEAHGMLSLQRTAAVDLCAQDLGFLTTY